MKTKKITIDEFFNSKETLAIRCKNEIDVDSLFNAFDKKGKTWRTGCRYCSNDMLDTYWYLFGSKTCYTNDGCFYDVKLCKNANYKIYNFENVILK